MTHPLAPGHSVTYSTLEPLSFYPNLYLLQKETSLTKVESSKIQNIYINIEKTNWTAGSFSKTTISPAASSPYAYTHQDLYPPQPRLFLARFPRYPVTMVTHTRPVQDQACQTFSMGRDGSSTLYLCLQRYWQLKAAEGKRVTFL